MLLVELVEVIIVAEVEVNVKNEHNEKKNLSVCKLSKGRNSYHLAFYENIIYLFPVFLAVLVNTAQRFFKTRGNNFGFS